MSAIMITVKRLKKWGGPRIGRRLLAISADLPEFEPWNPESWNHHIPTGDLPNEKFGQ
jgi:hypothetical protein